ncbi:RNA polymerase sigma factor [Dermatobacter hominis]|uniref:RNA polymerase sigma factor n=1 Tax=Dermatobacter hominis TaxID=2884263 RepID=UPI001D126946|nr:sigma factor-like helix-turn-helix DNA-binding protein [Dermatobacter hominis]UDY37114.1 hypothetical protein LH044_06145 [Dermatobacter hominis]
MTGSQERLDALFRDRYAPLVRLATLLAGSRAVAEEVVMDAFEQLAPRLDEVAEPAAYLRTSVVNGVRSSHRRAATAERFRRPVDAAVPAPDLDEMWDRLHALRPEVRACVVLRYYEDLPLDAIADALDLPLGTVKSHLHRGLSSLRDLLAEEGS